VNCPAVWRACIVVPAILFLPSPLAFAPVSCPPLGLRFDRTLNLLPDGNHDPLLGAVGLRTRQSPPSVEWRGGLQIVLCKSAVMEIGVGSASLVVLHCNARISRSWPPARRRMAHLSAYTAEEPRPAPALPRPKNRLHRSVLPNRGPAARHQRRRRCFAAQRMTILTPRRKQTRSLRARASSIEPKRRLHPSAPSKAPFPRGPSVCVRRKMMCTPWTSSAASATRQRESLHAAFEPTLGQARQATLHRPAARPVI